MESCIHINDWSTTGDEKKLINRIEKNVINVKDSTGKVKKYIDEEMCTPIETHTSVETRTSVETHTSIKTHTSTKTHTSVETPIEDTAMLSQPGSPSSDDDIEYTIIDNSPSFSASAFPFSQMKKRSMCTSALPYLFVCKNCGDKRDSYKKHLLHIWGCAK
jgi:hypothetical protein